MSSTTAPEKPIYLPQEVRFKLYCGELPNKDSLGAGTSDAYAKVFARKGGVWVLLGTTEVINENEDPTWKYEFVDKNCILGVNQYWKIEIWEHDVGKDDFIGNALVSVDDYFKCAEFKILPLSDIGTVTILKSKTPK